MVKTFPTLGCCGLDCGLCPRYYTKGSSQCPGCCGQGFENKHPPCSVITCCVKKKNLEVCAECPEFVCGKFDKKTFEVDSFITHKRIMANQNSIKKFGIDLFIGEQKKRMSILADMLDKYDNGRCKSYLCLAAALLSLRSLTKALKVAEKEVKDKSIDRDDRKGKARIMKRILEQFATEENEDLRLRKP